MNQETVSVVSRYGVAELLQHPLGGGMRRHVRMQNLARRMVHDHEHIQEANRGCDDDTKPVSAINVLSSRQAYSIGHEALMPWDTRGARPSAIPCGHRLDCQQCCVDLCSHDRGVNSTLNKGMHSTCAGPWCELLL
jgi:hypothetical protein